MANELSSVPSVSHWPNLSKKLYYHHRAGRIETWYWRPMIYRANVVFSSQGFRGWWAERQGFLSKGFGEFLESEVFDHASVATQIGEAGLTPPRRVARAPADPPA